MLHLTMFDDGNGILIGTGIFFYAYYSNSKKIPLYAMRMITNELRQNFARGPTAQLSGHMQNFVAMHAGNFHWHHGVIFITFIFIVNDFLKWFYMAIHVTIPIKLLTQQVLESPSRY